jgi:hypothetical protein
MSRISWIFWLKRVNSPQGRSQARQPAWAYRRCIWSE